MSTSSSSSVKSSGSKNRKESNGKSKSTPPLRGEVIVFLMNQTGLCVPIADESGRSRTLTAKDIISNLKEQLNYGVELFTVKTNERFEDTVDTFGGHRSSTSLAAHCDASSAAKSDAIFALWMTSPLLELQLLPEQKPYTILAKWSQLLAKYTSAERDQIDRDEPVLSYQRNVFLKKDMEAFIDDINVLELLYEEAKINVLDGRYPSEDYEILAATQAAIELGPFNAAQHTADYFKLKGQSYLPLFYRTQASEGKTPWFVTSRRGHSSIYNKIVEHYKLIDANLPRFRLIRGYLELCWKYNFYGAAYFSGQIERATRGPALLVSHHDKKVWVAINSYGLHVIDKKLTKLMFSLDYDEFKWQVGLPTDATNPNALHCLFVQINLRPPGPGTSGASGGNDKECKLIQIFSRQASLMANLINHFTASLQQRDVPDSGSYREDLVTSTKPVERKNIKKLDKLSCATFNAKGECVRQQGSFRVVN